MPFTPNQTTMRKLQLFIMAFMLVSLVATSCKKDEPVDDTPVDKHTMLLEKTWYNSPNQGRGDHFFGSDGTMQITNPTWGGTFVWGPNDSMTVITTGGVTVNWWFKTITADYMEYWPTNEDPANIYKFSTTKP